MVLSCYLCTKECNGIEEYTQHLRNVHVLTEPCTICCNADGCRQTFCTYNSLRRHIRKQHAENLLLSSSFTSISMQDSASVCDSDSETITHSSVQVNADAVPNVDEFGVSQAALKFLLALVSSNSLPLSNVNFIRNSTQELIKEILSFLKCKLLKTMEIAGMDVNNLSMFQDLLADFDGWASPFCWHFFGATVA